MSYADIGGMDIQKQEMREAVELPLTHHDLYKQIGMLLRAVSVLISFDVISFDVIHALPAATHDPYSHH